MFFEPEGDLQVLTNLLLKKELFDAGDPAHEAIVPEIFIDGGAMRGTCGAGHAASLEKNGIFRTPVKIYAASTGFPVALCACTGQVQEVRETYWEYCSTEDFFSRKRMRHEGQAMNIDGLVKNLSGRIRVEALPQSPLDFYGVMTCAETGQGVLIEEKKSINPLNDMRASIALPWFSHANVDIGGGRRCVDGAGAYPFLARLAQSNSTDVLVLANSPKGEGPSALGGLASSIFLRSLPPKTREAFASQPQRYVNDLAEFRKPKAFRKLILWMSKKNTIGPFEQDSAKLKAASYEAEKFLDGLFAQCRLSASA